MVRLPAIVLFAWCTAATAWGGTPSIPHVRTAERHMLSLLRDGVARSATFKRLVEAVERSDVIVYLETSADCTMRVDAQLHLAGATPSNRFLRISVKIPTGDDTAIALVGHELQHVMEVAQAAEVRDQQSFHALYRRIGDENDVGWETQAARATGETIREELRHVPSGAVAEQRSPQR